MLLYILIALVIGLDLYYLISAILKKKYKDIPAAVLFLIFEICLLIMYIAGGSAVQFALNDPDWYLNGQYFLYSHGDRIDVPFAVYLFVMATEIVGLLCGLAAVVVSLVFRFRKTDDE